VATLQGVVLLALAGLVDVPYDPQLLAGALALVFLLAFAITAFGLVIAVRVKTVQTVMPLVQLLLTPLMFLSGALFPTGGDIPAWLRVAVRLNPISYGIDAMHALLRHVTGDTGGRFATGLTWWGWPVPAWLDVVVVGATGVVLLGVAAVLFSATE
jgi:ABC-2 type transport system permease protein